MTLARSNTLALAIETSGRFGSIALGRGAEIIGCLEFSAAFRHAVELLPCIERLIDSHGASPDDLSEVYVSGGPGSFTGLRIGVTVARTLAWSIGAQIVRVPTLEVVAQNALAVSDPPDEVAVILDAKRNKVYAAAFRLSSGSYVGTGAAAEVEPAAFFATLPRTCHIMGEGVPFAGDAVAKSGLPVLHEDTFKPRADVVFSHGQMRAATGAFDDARILTPIYVRRPEAEEVWQRRMGPGC